MSGNWRARYQQVELASKAITIPLFNPRERLARDICFMRIMAFQPDVKGDRHCLDFDEVIYLARP